MPNGGPNCTLCVFNRPHRDWCIAKQSGRTNEDFEDNRQRTRDQAYCLVHDRPLESPYWTCCKYGTDMWREEVPRHFDPVGRQSVLGIELPVEPGSRLEALPEKQTKCSQHPHTRWAAFRLVRPDGATQDFCSAECYLSVLGHPHDTGA